MNNDEKIRIKNHPLFSYSVSVSALFLRHIPPLLMSSKGGPYQREALHVLIGITP